MDTSASQTLEFIDAQHWDADAEEPKPWNRFQNWNRDTRRRFNKKAKDFKVRNWDFRPRRRQVVHLILGLLLLLTLMLIATLIIWGVGQLLGMISPLLTLAWYIVVIFMTVITPSVRGGYRY